MKAQLFGMVLLLCSAVTRCSAQAEAIYATAVVRALNSSHVSNFVSHFCPGCSHTTWVAIYQDGTQVFNDFQSRRGPVEVANYFGGYTNGDCDSRDQHGRTYCYRGVGEAGRHVANHGRIVDIQMLDRNDHWKSVLALVGQTW